MSRRPTNTRQARSALSKLAAAPVESEVEMVGKLKEIAPEARTRMEQAGLSEADIKYFAMFKKHGPEADVKLRKFETMEAIADTSAMFGDSISEFASQISNSIASHGLSEGEEDSEDNKKIKDAAEKLIKKEIEKVKEEIAKLAKEEAKALALRHNSSEFSERESQEIIDRFAAQASKLVHDLRDMIYDLQGKIKEELDGRQALIKAAELQLVRHEVVYQLDIIKIGEKMSEGVTSVINSITAKEGDSDAILEMRRVAEEAIKRKLAEEREKIALQVDEARALLDSFTNPSQVRSIIEQITLKTSERNTEFFGELSAIVSSLQLEIDEQKRFEEQDLARKSEIESVIQQGHELALAQERAALEAETARLAELRLQEEAQALERQRIAQESEAARLAQVASELTLAKAQINFLLDGFEAEVLRKTDATALSFLTTIVVDPKDIAAVADQKRIAEEIIKAKAAEEQKKVLEEIEKTRRQVEEETDKDQITALEGEVSAQFAVQVSDAVKAVAATAVREKSNLAEKKEEVQKAAIAIQKVERGFIARKDVKKQQAAALDIQRLFRGHKGRIEANVAALKIAKSVIFEEMDKEAESAIIEVSAYEEGHDIGDVVTMRRVIGETIIEEVEKRKAAIASEVTRAEIDIRSAKRTAHPGKIAVVASRQIAEEFQSACQELVSIVDTAKIQLTEEVTRAEQEALVAAAELVRQDALRVRLEAEQRAEQVRMEKLLSARSIAITALEKAKGEIANQIHLVGQTALSELLPQEGDNDEVTRIKDEARQKILAEEKAQEEIAAKIAAMKARVESLEDLDAIEAEVVEGEETALSILRDQGFGVAKEIAVISQTAQEALTAQRVAALGAARVVARKELDDFTSSIVQSVTAGIGLARLSINSVSKSPSVARGSALGSKEAEAEDLAIQKAKEKAEEEIAKAKKEAEEEIAKAEDVVRRIAKEANEKGQRILKADNLAEVEAALEEAKASVGEQRADVPTLISDVARNFAAKVANIRSGEEVELRAAVAEANRATRQAAADAERARAAAAISAIDPALMADLPTATSRTTPTPPRPVADASPASEPAVVLPTSLAAPSLSPATDPVSVSPVIDHSIVTANGRRLSSGDVLRATRALRKISESQSLNDGNITALSKLANLYGKGGDLREVMDFSSSVISSVKKQDANFFTTEVAAITDSVRGDAARISTRHGVTAVNFGTVLNTAAEDVLKQKLNILSPSSSVRSPGGFSATRLAGSAVIGRGSGG